MKITPVLALVLGGCAAYAAPVPPSAAPARTPVTLTYLGVAGWQISDGTHVVLVDPYFSRPSLDGAPLVPDEDAIAARAPSRADLILVGHSHFDHALDVPAVARRTGAEVLGSESTIHLARASGVPADRLIAVKGGEDYQFDGFSVRVIPSLHSAIDHKHAADGAKTIPADVKLPMPAAGYVEGGTFAYLVRMGGHEVFVLSTANFIERELEGLRPDAAIVAVGLRQEVHDYSCRLERVLGHPPLVLASHFDAFRDPQGESSLAGLGAEARADLAQLPEEFRRCDEKAARTRVVVPEYGKATLIP
jgi:L-ascorbate metabolism protein UlaG (beta-lactamase superfamily)